MDKNKLGFSHFISDLLQGDKTAYKLVSNRVTKYLWRLGFGTDLERDELASAAMMALLQNLRTGRFRGGSVQSFNLYLLGIVRFKVWEELRRRGKQEVLRSANDDEPGISPRLDVAIDAGRARTVIFEKLSEECAELLRLRFEEQWSNDEIAQNQKKNKNAVAVSVSRCLEKARVILRQEGFM